VFMLLLGAFAVPGTLQQRVLLFGIVGALLPRSAFIALGAAALDAFQITFLPFGLVLVAPGVKVLKDTRSGHAKAVDANSLASARLLRRFFPLATEYHGTAIMVSEHEKRALTPLALVVVVVFAVDSVPAVHGITGDPYLVFATNAFALLGLRARRAARRSAHPAGPPRPRPRRHPRLHRRQAGCCTGRTPVGQAFPAYRGWPRCRSS